SRPSTTLSAVPSAISSGATFTLTGTAWDRVGDVTGVTYAATNLTLIDETFTPMSADAMDTPATFSATFQALDAVGTAWDRVGDVTGVTYAATNLTLIDGNLHANERRYGHACDVFGHVSGP
ncbi:hypothetical protein BCU43_025730, partial [Vibrio lentus]